MNQSLGNVITGLVTDMNEKAYFIQKDGVTYKLLKNETTQYELGDTVEGFAYVSLNKETILTQDIPTVRIGKFAWATVVDTRKDLGVFMDVGLPDKELVVSLDELPVLKHLWPKKGDQLMITVKVDEKDRMWGTLVPETVFESLAQKASADLNNQNITATAYRLKMVGTFVFTSDNHLGFIHPSERKDEPRMGEVVSGRVIGVRPDGVLNISLMPRAHEAIDDDAGMLLAILERTANGSFPYTDKSDANEIRERFGISKSQFKRALGNLMKQRMIIQEDGETKLVQQAVEPTIEPIVEAANNDENIKE
ncbi:CvfB family protein [Carnobacterium funditum]|uniref:CvfB family protein n=1 Tax=Carnobacterium funditum TaxID=2752 RepID=UPI00068C09D5|nr:S1-like domain-containing RNA-binding protein [Carnobacterium funditum]